VSAAELDRRALIFARTRCHAPASERAIAAFSRLGEHGACWIGLGLTGAALDRGPRRRAWLCGAGIVAGAYVSNQAVKFVIRRKRPELPGLPPLTPVVTRLSFPSAHATTAFAGARAYSRLAHPAPLYAAAAAFAASRPYLGVHYPSDVIAGAALGTLLAECWQR
jgi:membrane-associated phospholipid phosphatase